MDSRRGVISIPLIRVTVTKTKKKGGRTVFHPIDRAVGGGGGWEELFSKLLLTNQVNRAGTGNDGDACFHHKGGEGKKVHLLKAGILVQ